GRPTASDGPLGDENSLPKVHNVLGDRSAAHHVTLVYPQRPIICRTCGIRTERVEFADPKARITRRLRQQIGVDCQSMPTSHAAIRHCVSWDKARRAEKAFLAEWDRTRVKRRPRHIGLDEIQRGKGQRFWTVLSDVVHGEVIGLRQDRTEATATALLAEDLTARQHAVIDAVCTDMDRPYLNAVGATLPSAEIIFDKFHVLQHASAALDEVRRQEFFRAGPVMREHGRGKPVAVVATVEDGARIETQGTPGVVCGEPPTVQSLCAARATRSTLDIQDAARRPPFPDGLVQGPALATAARNGAAR